MLSCSQLSRVPGPGWPSSGAALLRLLPIVTFGISARSLIWQCGRRVLPLPP